MVPIWQQGDCDNDTDCAGDLKCFKRDIGEDVPGCVGNTVKQAGTGTDYCYEVASNTPNPTNPSQSASPTTTPPTPGIQLDPVGNDGSITGSGSLGLCQGDCDDDSDCQVSIYLCKCRVLFIFIWCVYINKFTHMLSFYSLSLSLSIFVLYITEWLGMLF